jgi:predicted GNAT superfamily acetyltransferase
MTMTHATAAAKNPEITIRRPHAPQEYVALQEAQKRAWGITQDGYVVPVATMIGAQYHGGLVLGAFLPEGEVVGLSFSFPGIIHGELCLYSQLTGIVPGYQGKGIGSKMKWAQWEFAKNHQIPIVAWAFDPFQTGNAHFNMHLLGAKSRRYIDDMYGPRSDALNMGVPTDRLIAEWPTNTEPRAHIKENENLEQARRVIETQERENGYRTVAFVHDHLRDDVMLLEIPRRIHKLQAEDREQADRWRLAVREAFHTVFHDGYVVTDFVRLGEKPDERCFFKLERNVWL